MMLSIPTQVEKLSAALNERKRMVSRHKVMQGIDFITVADSKTFIVNFIKPDKDVVLDKKLPQFEASDFVFTVETDGFCFNPELELSFVRNTYGVRFKIKESLNANAHITIKITTQHRLVDKFFSQADYTLANTYFDYNEYSEPQDDNYKAISRLDYLAKDYASFKRLIENELNVTDPLWREDNSADMMITISEVLAYSADFLSYQQDSVATEAYLETARFDVSLRRHCRLLDYQIKRKVNSRAWVQCAVSTNVNLPLGTSLLCGEGDTDKTVITDDEYKGRSGGKEPIFETMHDLRCVAEFNSMELCSWGLQNYILEQGGTNAVLKGHKKLKLGDAIAFTNKDGQKVQVVRLIADAEMDIDPLTQEEFTTVHWYENDRLDAAWQSTDCVILGNLVLVDQGETIDYEKLDLLENNSFFSAAFGAANIIYTEKYNHNTAQSASSIVKQNVYKALPFIQINESAVSLPDSAEKFHNEINSKLLKNSHAWYAVRDFLKCTPYSRSFVMQGSQTSTQLFFGNGVYGAMPSVNTEYWARYRINPKTTTKITTDAINQVYFSAPSEVSSEQIIKVTNITESINESHSEKKEITKKIAPIAHRIRNNLALPQDYINKIRTFSDVKDVHFKKSWAGSRYQYDFYVYPVGGMTEDRLNAISQSLAVHKVLNHRYSLSFYRPLLLHILIDLQFDSSMGTKGIRLKLRALFSGTNANAFFSDKFSFNDELYPSEVIKSVFKLQGVLSASLMSFQKLDDYVGSNMYAVVDKIQPQATEIISYSGNGRTSIIKIRINGGEYV